MSWTLNFNAAVQSFLTQHLPDKALELPAQEGTGAGLQWPGNIKGSQRPSLISLTSITWSLSGGERPEVGKGEMIHGRGGKEIR